MHSMQEELSEAMQFMQKVGLPFGSFGSFENLHFAGTAQMIEERHFLLR